MMKNILIGIDESGSTIHWGKDIKKQKFTNDKMPVIISFIYMEEKNFHYFLEKLMILRFKYEYFLPLHPSEWKTNDNVPDSFKVEYNNLLNETSFFIKWTLIYWDEFVRKYSQNERIKINPEPYCISMRCMINERFYYDYDHLEYRLKKIFFEERKNKEKMYMTKNYINIDNYQKPHHSYHALKIFKEFHDTTWLKKNFEILKKGETLYSSILEIADFITKEIKNEVKKGNNPANNELISKKLKNKGRKGYDYKVFPESKFFK